MSQREGDRLVALKKAKTRLITQRQGAEEMGISDRQVRRLLRALQAKGDRAVIHGLRGRPSNRRISEKRGKKIGRGQERGVRDPKEMPPTQIGRALTGAGHRPDPGPLAPSRGKSTVRSSRRIPTMPIACSARNTTWTRF